MGVLLAILCIMPSLIWIFLDNQPFGGDQSGYGTASLRLYYTLTQLSSEWFVNMLDAIPHRGPGIAWVGQFFAGFGVLVGSIDRALLITIVLVQVLSVYLVFLAVREWAGGRPGIAALALLVTASAPLLVGFSHLFFIEPFQMLVVAWFLLILSRMLRWSKPLVLSQLLLASLVALTIKATSPLYVFVIGLVILANVFVDLKNIRSWNWGERKIVITWAASVVLLVMLVMWYWENGSTVLKHTLYSTSNPNALHWGKEDTFLRTLGYWFQEVRRTFFPRLTLLTSAGLLAAGVLYKFRDWKCDPRKLDFFDLTCIVIIIQVLIVLVVFSLGVMRWNRFLLPILPYLAVLVSWTVQQIPSRVGITLAVLAFGLQLTASHAFLLNVIPGQTLLFDFSKIGHLQRLNTDTTNAQILDEIVSIACADPEGGTPLTVIAIDPGLRGDWIAPVPAEYTAVKRFGLRPPCRFGYAGNNFWGASIEKTWDNLLDLNAHFVITTDPEIYPPPVDAANQALTIENHPRLIEMLRIRKTFEESSPLTYDEGILVFERVAFLSKGRALLDSGNIELGIKVLETATELEPDNSEVWANLTLGYVLATRREDALTAGSRALSINPDHFYVHLMIASIHQQRANHITALSHIKEAVRSAPSDQEKMRAVRAQEQSLLALGNERQACLALAGASGISELNCEAVISGD